MQQKINKETKKLSAFKEAFLYALFLSATICFISPLMLIDANKIDFSINNGVSFTLNMALIASLFFISFFVVFFVLLKIWKHFSFLITFALAAIFCWSLYLPLGSGLLDGIAEIQISHLNLAIGLGIGVVAAFLHSKRFIILPLILIGPFVTASLSFVNNVKTGKIVKPLPVSTNNLNIFEV